MDMRLTIGSDGIHVQSQSVGRLAYALYRRRPKLFVRELDLEKLLLGGAHWYSAATHARITGDLLRPSTGLATSPYVQLLSEYKSVGESLFSESRFVTTPYYKHAMDCIKAYGRYAAASGLEGIVQKARQFCRMLDGTWINGSSEYDSGPDDPVEVRRIKFSDCYEIVDGHHRLALAFVRGRKRFPCSILPTEGAITPIQQMVMDSVWLAGKKKLSQPIDVPELKTWPIARKCSDRFELMMSSLSRIGVQQGSFLDIGSNYGWFVAQMSKRGFRAVGVERDAVAAAVGLVAYGIDPSAIHVTEPSAFLAAARQRYDVVCCLSILQRFVLKKETIPADAFVREVDRITGSILFFDTAESHERDYGKALKGWDAEYIRSWLRDNTSFKTIELLGADSDLFQRHRYGRHLFACIR